MKHMNTNPIDSNPTRLPRVYLLMTMLSVLILTCMPVGLHAQSGGGNGKGKPGGGGGGEEPPPPEVDPMTKYTVKRILLPQGMFVPSNPGMRGLNSAGQACGATAIQMGGNTSVRGPAFIWDGQEVVLLPGEGDRTAGEAIGLSDPVMGEQRGIVVGRSWDPANPNATVEAVTWQPAGGSYESVQMNALRPAEAEWYLEGTRGISADGRFVVFEARRTWDGKVEAVVAELLFDEDGRILGLASFMPIGTFAGASGSVTGTHLSFANGIHHNSEGTVRVTGYAISEQGSGNVFVWERDAEGNQYMTDLDRGHGQGLNSHGQVAGWRHVNGGGGYRGLYWDFSGTEYLEPIELRLQSEHESTAVALNDFNYVVGWANQGNRNAQAHAYIWHPDKGIWSLNDLLAPDPTLGNKFHLSYATCINNYGQILVRARDGQSSSFWVHLDPVP